jgi:hypothetical protein
MEVFMNRTVNRKNISDPVNKLNDIEKALLKYIILYVQGFVTQKCVATPKWLCRL